jgi:hypothetical protein
VVAPDDIAVFLDVVEREGEDAVQVLKKVRAVLSIERKDDFAVGLGKELVFAGESRADILMVVDLAVYRER